MKMGLNYHVNCGLNSKQNLAGLHKHTCLGYKGFGRSEWKGEKGNGREFCCLYSSENGIRKRIFDSLSHFFIL